ncbi:11623_t:CDS:2, partial [Cetraspora pellucida]
LPTHPKRIFEDFVPLPELVLFIQKVTTKARIDVRTTIIALILVLRFKNKIQKKSCTSWLHLFTWLVDSPITFGNIRDDIRDDIHDIIRYNI